MLNFARYEFGSAVKSRFKKVGYTLNINIYFISRGNILNNKVSLPYGPQTITMATKHTGNCYKLRVTQDLDF